jgi:hypothetical protein
MSVFARTAIEATANIRLFDLILGLLDAFGWDW